MALAVVCAVAVLHPAVVDSLPTVPRVVLGLALITSGLLFAGVVRSRRRTGNGPAAAGSATSESVQPVGSALAPSATVRRGSRAAIRR